VTKNNTNAAANSKYIPKTVTIYKRKNLYSQAVYSDYAQPTGSAALKRALRQFLLSRCQAPTWPIV